jgi:hypothetical protein
VLTGENHRLIHLLNQLKTIAKRVVANLQDRLGRWMQPLKETLVGGAVNDAAKGKGELIAENALLRQQLIVVKRQIKRSQLKGRDRLLLVFLTSKVRTWRQALLLVKPETVLSWHRQLFRLVWKRKTASREYLPRPLP